MSNRVRKLAGGGGSWLASRVRGFSRWWGEMNQMTMTLSLFGASN
jgi:hypothetical protein